MDNKELTMILISCFMEKKVSMQKIGETFDLSENKVKHAIKQLLQRKAIFNFDFSKREMKLISSQEYANLTAKTDVNKEELLNEYCIFNDNITIDGTLKVKNN